MKSVQQYVGKMVVCDKLVVLVTGYGNQNSSYRCFSGVVVSGNDDFKVGTYSRTWDLSTFHPFFFKISFTPLVTGQEQFKPENHD